MTQKEMTRLRVINQTIDKVITIREAAELLDLSERQVIRLKKGVLKEGPAFIVEPENPQPAFRPLDPAINLDYILCIKERRTIIEGSAFSYKGKYYQLVKDGKKVPAMPKAKLTVLFSPKIGVKAFYAGTIYDTLILEERPKKQALQQPEHKSEKKHNPVKPAPDRPWKQQAQKRPRISYEETDREILEMLDQLFNSTRAWA